MYLFLIPLVVGLASVALGLLCAIRPALVIELQRRFYLMINWKIEPLSMGKELRNTRVMGFFLIGFVLAAIVIAGRVFVR